MSESLGEKIYKDLIETDPDMRNMEYTFHTLLHGMGDDLIQEVAKQCMQTVAVYEQVLSRGKCEDLWETFINTLKGCNYNENNQIDPREYVNYYTFKLKCILTVIEIVNGNCKTMAEAVYAACNSEDYKEIEKTVGEARKAFRKLNPYPNYSSWFCWPVF